MTRAERVAAVLAGATTLWWWMPMVRDYGIAAGLFWLAVMVAFLVFILWAAGATRKGSGS